MDRAPKPSSSLAAGEDFLVRKALAGIPAFPPDRTATAHLTRLFGLTNRVYAVEVEGRRYCLRLPGSGTRAIIDRRVEETNARRAVNGDWEINGRETFARRRSDVTPETPVRDVEK